MKSKSNKIRWFRILFYLLYVAIVVNNAYFSLYYFRLGNNPAGNGYLCAAVWCLCSTLYIVWMNRRDDKDRKRIITLGEAIDALNGSRKCVDYAMEKMREAL